MERNEWYKPDGQRDFRGTKAETWCNEFESSVLDVDGLKIIPQTVSDAEYIYEQTKYDSNNKKLKFRQAGTILYQNDVYFLSAEEADRYLGPVYNDKVAYMPESTSASAWYLRSTEISTGNNSATEVKADGELAYVNADQTRAARPVFWASFSDKASFDLKTDESGNRTWTYEESSAVPEPVEEAKAAEEKKATEEKAKAEAEAKARAVTSVTVGGSTVTADSINAAVAAAGGKTDYVTEIIIGKGVKKISKNAFAGTKVTTMIVQTKKLKKKSVKGSLRGSAVTTIKVQVGKAKANKNYVKKYKKIFTKKNAGKKAKVKK